MLVSGRANEAVDSSAVRLHRVATLLRPGQVSFSFQVDAQPNADGLQFWIDGEQVLSLQSQQAEWHQVSKSPRRDVVMSDWDAQQQCKLVALCGDTG